MSTPHDTLLPFAFAVGLCSAVAASAHMQATAVAQDTGVSQTRDAVPAAATSTDALASRQDGAEAVVIDGPPAPHPPEVITRDAQGRATVRAVRLSEPLRVDGRLDEAIYDSVPAIIGLVQQLPDEGAPSTEKTEAWVLFDERHIYVAARCHDSAPPSEWVANEMRRDSNNLRNNDNFGVLLDTFYDRRNGMMFFTNPLGGIADTAITDESTPNLDWNQVWEVRTGRFEGGWTVEIAIPFKSLRYPPRRTQVWGIQFRRVIRRKNEWTYLTPVPISAAGPSGQMGIFRISAAATLVGVEAPPRSRNLDIKPYAISGLRTDRSASPPVTNTVDRELGVDAKYGLPHGLTADVTYNTDFAQVEVDEQQVNLTRFNLLFPEKREFFLESRGLFDFGLGGGVAGGGGGGGGSTPTIFFSRRIGLNGGRVVPIVAGGRLTGKVGGYGIGALNIQTGEEPVNGTAPTNFTAVRLKRDILRRSSLGAIFTGRSTSVTGDGSTQAYGVDGAFSFYDNVNFSGYYARTDTPGLRGRDASYEARFIYDGDRYGLQADHLLIGDHFNPEVGFVRRDDVRRSFLSARFSPRPRRIEWIRQLRWEGTLDYILAATTGTLETRERQLSFETEFENSDRLGVTLTSSYEFLERPFPIASGIAIPPGGYPFTDLRASYALGLQRRTSGSVTFQRGSFYSGEITAVGLTRGRIEVTPQVSLEPTLSLNWITLPEGSFTSHLAVTRVNYTFTPRMFLSGLLQYSSGSDAVSTNLRLRWEYQPGSELFVVYTEERATDLPRSTSLRNRGIVVKVNRLFRY